jgi:general secretion pathway protein D
MKLKPLITLVLLAGLLVRPAMAQAPAATSGGSGAPSATEPLQATGDGITLNFRDADVDAVVAAFARLLNRNIVVDQRVRGKMTLEAPQAMSRQQALTLLQVALRGQGFAMVEVGGLMRVVPEAEAKLLGVGVRGETAAPASGEQVITQVFRLTHESAANLVPVLRPLIAPNNTIAAYAGNNSLVVTDYASNLARVASIIAALDRPSGSEVEVIPLSHAIAADVAVSVSRLLDEAYRAGATSAQGAAPTGAEGTQRISVLADPRLNAVLVRSAHPERLRLAKSLVARLDQPTGELGNIHVVYLRNAEAVKLAQTLRGILSGEAGGAGAGSTGSSSTLPQSSLMATGGSGSPGSAGGTSSAGMAPLSSAQPGQTSVSGRAGAAIITADPANNALIITAPEPLYRNLRAVIDQLDARRAQVFIESLIVEISASKAAELGIQWQFLEAPAGSTRGFGGTNFNAQGSGGNILGTTASVANVGAGLNLGVVRGTTNLPGVGTVLNLGLLARALESDADANILATPNLLTLDNEEARIIIGQNVPFITGQFTATGSAGAAVNPFQTIERRDVGTTLRVKPQISESGSVRLQIFQEVSSVQSTSLSAGIITNRRAIESTVLVDDGQIIVLGGLIEERIDGGEQKIPGLGDIPGIGGLFRYDNRRRTKTNLLVFLRPVVLRDAEASHSVSATRYDYIRAVRGDARIPGGGLLPEISGRPLPAMSPPPQRDPQGRLLVPGTQTPPSSLSPDVDAAAPIVESVPIPLHQLRGGEAGPPGGGATPAPVRRPGAGG